MKIAICDDEPQSLAQISSILVDFGIEKRTGFTYQSFSSPIELLEEIRTENFDIVFLDVMMPILNGIETAQEIRTFNHTIKIIFLTFSTDFAFESYSVGAYTYLLKPIKKETLFPLLNKLLSDRQNDDDYLIAKCKTGIVRVVFSKLSHIEVLNKTPFFHMGDETVYEVSGTLSEYEYVLTSRPEFLRVHRAFLVNLWQMREITPQKFVSLSGKVIPISRRHYSQTLDAFMKSLFFKLSGGKESCL